MASIYTCPPPGACMPSFSGLSQDRRPSSGNLYFSASPALYKAMPVAKGSHRHFFAALLIFAVSCAGVRATSGGVIVPGPEGPEPIDETSNEQHPKQTCAASYRLDDITELNDEIRRCLIPSGHLQG